MKQIIKKYLGWLKDSNRPKHMKAGMLVFIAMLVFCFFPLDIAFCKSAIVALATTAIAAVVVEYIQKKCGFIFDWLDALATVLLPGLITMLSTFIASTL